MTSPSPAGAARSGSRKNQRQKPTARTSGTIATACPASVPTTATVPSTPTAVAMTGHPSRAIRSRSSLVAGAVHQATGRQPRHEAPELRADLLDGVLLGLAPQLLEVRLPAAVLRDPLVGERPRLDVLQERL